MIDLQKFASLLTLKNQLQIRGKDKLAMVDILAKVSIFPFLFYSKENEEMKEQQ